MDHSIFIYEPLNDGIANRIAQEVKEAGSNPISIRINSPGGNAHEGFAIYNLLRSIPNKVTTHADGIAASAASIVMMAGSERVMAEASQLMIHNSRGGAMQGMTADEMKQAIPVFEAIDDMAASIYSHGTGISKKLITEMMSTDTYITAKQAKKLGFATQLKTRLKAVALLTKDDMNLDKIYAMASNLGIYDSPEIKEKAEKEKEIATDLAEMAVAERIEKSEGAELLIKDLTPYLEFQTFQNEVKPLLDAMVTWIADQPTKEQIQASIKELMSVEMVNLLGKLKSKSIAPAEGGAFAEQSAEEFAIEQKETNWAEGITEAKEEVTKRTLSGNFNKIN